MPSSWQVLLFLNERMNGIFGGSYPLLEHITNPDNIYS